MAAWRDMNTLSVHFDTSPLTEMMALLSGKALDAAWRRALRKTLAWAKSQTAKTLSAETAIPQKILRRRLRTRLGKTGTVWLGLNPVKAHRLGNTRQTKAGVTAGRARFPGAFLVGRAPGTPAFRRVGKARLPIKAETLEWDVAGERGFEEVARQAENRLLTVLSQEINYELLKVTGRV